MGEYAQRLRQRLAAKSSSLPTTVPERRLGEPLPGGVLDMQALIQRGCDPIHAAYAYLQQLSAKFAEGVSQLPEMKPWTEAVEKAEQEYMPAGPPMSPLTRSYFWTWAYYDLRIGESTDTIARCQIAVNDTIWLNEHQLETLEYLDQSRMGIYEHLGWDGQWIRLRELITNVKLTCHCPSGYAGNPGELWFIRLVPPLEPQLASFWVAMTPPYILTGASNADWVTFLKRAMVQMDGTDEAARLHNLLKYGPEPRYWHEFVFKGYHHYQRDATFLAGLPDVQGTLPHV